MNENLLPQTPVIKDWLSYADKKLSSAGIISHRLDTELLLSFTLNVDRTYLHANSSNILDDKVLTVANKKLEKRLNHVPIAYIVGYKEFYGRKFCVNPSVLIPRPESEDIIEMLKKHLPSSTYRLPTAKLVDVGTGSGCLGITAKLELPELDVTLLDIDSSALSVAKDNAEKLSSKVSIKQNDLLSNYTDAADVIIANLPYVDESWERSIETKYEPQTALLADDKGMFIIKKLIRQATKIQMSDNLVLLEADPCQHSELINYAKKYNYECKDCLNYAILFVRH